jgi:hypothetical protein
MGCLLNPGLCEKQGKAVARWAGQLWDSAILRDSKKASSGGRSGFSESAKGWDSAILGQRYPNPDWY